MLQVQRVHELQRDLGGDPAIGADKILIVVYRYQRVETATPVREGNVLTLP